MQQRKKWTARTTLRRPLPRWGATCCRQSQGAANLSTVLLLLPMERQLQIFAALLPLNWPPNTWVPTTSTDAVVVDNAAELGQSMA